MKATLTLTLRDAAGRDHPVVVTAATANDTAVLFSIVGHLAACLHAYRPTGYAVEGVTTRVTDCPAGFFPKHWHPLPPPAGTPEGGPTHG